MYLKKIKIKNFRNIKLAEIEPGEKINFFLGENAQGKTNLIEAIYFSSFLKSFRTRNSEELIKENEKFSKIDLTINNNKTNNSISVNISRKRKYLDVDGKKPDKGNFYKFLNVVAFHPDEVNYISSYPVFRRNLIDRSIFYINFYYIDIYKKYLRCLKQRNAYLKSGNSDDDFFKEKLVEYGALIIRERLKYIDNINSILSSENFTKNNKERYSLEYSQKYPDRKNIKDYFLKDLLNKKNREKIVGYTLSGPHRDDILFYLNGRPAEKFASQGQRRSLVISFKTAQILDYQAVHGYSPVLLLDDMTSELDANRKNILLENLLVNSDQVFITATDFKQCHCSGQSKVFRVNQGEISLAD